MDIWGGRVELMFKIVPCYGQTKQEITTAVQSVNPLYAIEFECFPWIINVICLERYYRFFWIVTHFSQTETITFFSIFTFEVWFHFYNILISTEDATGFSRH